MSFSCSSEIADVIAFLIFLFDVEKHTVFQNLYVCRGRKKPNKNTPVKDWIWLEEKSEEFTVKMKQECELWLIKKKNIFSMTNSNAHVTALI